MKRLAATLLVCLLSAAVHADAPATRFSGLELTSHSTTVVPTTRYGLWVDSTARLRFDSGVASHYVLTLSVPLVAGDLVYAWAGNTLGRLPGVASGRYLRSGGVGTAPAWSNLSLPDAAATGDLLIGGGTNAITSLADVAAGAVLLSGGVGVTPAWGAVPDTALPSVGSAGSYTNGTGGSITTDAQGRVTAAVGVATRNVNVTAPVTGGGALSADVTVGCPSCIGGTLVSGRIPFSNGAQSLTDSSSFVFAGGLLTVTNITANASIKAQRIVNQSASPAIAVGSGGQLGTTPSATMSGGDISGLLTLTTGTTPSAFTAATAVTLGTVTFNTTFTAAPKSGLLHPCNGNAGAAATGANGVTAYFDQATFTTTQGTVKLISSGTPTLPASTALQFCYVVIQ